MSRFHSAVIRILEGVLGEGLRNYVVGSLRSLHGKREVSNVSRILVQIRAHAVS